MDVFCIKSQLGAHVFQANMPQIRDQAYVIVGVGTLKVVLRSAGAVEKQIGGVPAPGIPGKKQDARLVFLWVWTATEAGREYCAFYLAQCRKAQVFLRFYRTGYNGNQ